MLVSHTTGPITFVFVGKKFPSYAYSSLKLAEQYSGLPIQLIASQEIESRFRKSQVEFIALEDFYDSDDFKKVISKVMLPHGFRDGFWLKTLERLFVLEQYFKKSSISSILHAELDQMLFRVDILMKRLLDVNQKGVFVPFHDATRAVASILFCNSKEKFSDLIQFSVGGEPFPNEMVLLANWAEKSGNLVALPTVWNFLDEEKTPTTSPFARGAIPDIDGAVDAIQLGTWITGIDPFTVPASQVPRNHFVEPGKDLLSGEQLLKSKFEFDGASGFLRMLYPGLEPINIYNIHVHSKVHSWIAKKQSNLPKLFLMANQSKPVSLPGARRRQLLGLYEKANRLVLEDPSRFWSDGLKLANIFLKRRPSSKPFISGDSFRHLSDYEFDGSYKERKGKSGRIEPIVFCQSDMLPTFASNILPKIKGKVKLLLGNSDQNFDLKAIRDLNLENVRVVFSQNLVEAIDGWHVLPIGLENAILSRNGRVKWFENSIQRDLVEEKLYRVMSSFSIWTNPVVRSRAKIDLANSKVVDDLGNLTAKSHHINLRKYAFVACPEGNGVDTHRVWEAMYLKTIPVVSRNYLSEFYWSLGLPVCIVESFEDLKEWNENKALEVYLKLRPRFTSEYLWLETWWKKILES